MKADKRLKAAIAAGELSFEMACEMCGQREGCIQLHLEDYSRIETSMPICVEHHMLLHTRFTHPNRWQRAVMAALRGELSKPWSSAGHYFKAHPWRRDEPELSLWEWEEWVGWERQRQDWWLYLKMYPINVKEEATA